MAWRRSVHNVCYKLFFSFLVLFVFLFVFLLFWEWTASYWKRLATIVAAVDLFTYFHCPLLYRGGKAVYFPANNFVHCLPREMSVESRQKDYVVWKLCLWWFCNIFPETTAIPKHDTLLQISRNCIVRVYMAKILLL